LPSVEQQNLRRCLQGRSAVDKVVAQISNRFPICCIAGLPACESCGPSHASKIRTVCRLEIGDTAGWKPNATNFGGARPRGSIPKGLHLSAQGCEERATLGETNNNPINPERVAARSSWHSSTP